MIVIACLGNPGPKYRKTRHNAGFLAGEYLIELHGLRQGPSKFQSSTASGSIHGADCLFLFPQTYMNNSGQAVRAALAFHKLGVEHLIVLHDELELAFGDVRHKKGGGHKGHNGLRSIIQECGSADFERVRIGIGRPPRPEMQVADYVLSDFSPSEMQDLHEHIARVDVILKDAILS